MHTVSLPAALLLMHLKPELGATVSDQFEALFYIEGIFLTFYVIFPFIKGRSRI